MSQKESFLLALAILVLLASACSAQPTPAAPTPTVGPTLTPMPVRLPAADSEVPRVTTGEAKAALEKGAAVIVDVRSPAAFQMSHVAGAISIPLADIEAKPNDLKLDKNQWIFTYCT